MKSQTKRKIKFTVKSAMSVWRIVIFVVSVAFILPLSIAKLENKTFYYTIFSVCLLIMVIAFLGKVLANQIRKKRIKFIRSYVNLMLLYSFISLALYFITFLIMILGHIKTAHAVMVIAALALSLTISRARVLLIFL